MEKKEGSTRWLTGKRGRFVRRAGVCNGAGVFHVAHLPDPGGDRYDPRAACNVQLQLNGLTDLRDVPAIARCRRGLCAVSWPL